MNTETLDKLYLEWSQFTSARTAREIAALRALRSIVCDGTTPPHIVSIANHALQEIAGPWRSWGMKRHDLAGQERAYASR